MRFLAGFWMLGALAAQVPLANAAAAAEPAPAVTASPEMIGVCARISALVIPADRVAIRIDRMLPQLVQQVLMADPDFAEMEAAYPGLADAMVTAWRPIMVKASSEVMPQYREDMAALYCRSFSLSELREIEAFLASPAFQALQNNAYNNLSTTRTSRDLTQDRDISASSIRGDLAETGARAHQDLPPEYQRQIATFMKSPLGRKMAGIGQQKLAIDAKWANYLPPWAEKEIETVTIDAMIAHIAKTDPETAQNMRAALSQDSGKAKRN